jgi:hypothetical protein
MHRVNHSLRATTGRAPVRVLSGRGRRDNNPDAGNCAHPRTTGLPVKNLSEDHPDRPDEEGIRPLADRPLWIDSESTLQDHSQ